MHPAATNETKNLGRVASASHSSSDKRFEMLDAAMKRHQYQQSALIEVLHKAQELFGYLEDDIL